MDLEAAEKSSGKDDASIFWLNDDCLYYIFSYLKLKALIITEEVCKRFEAVTQQTYKSLKMLDFSDDILCDLNSPKAIKAACRVGPYVSFIKSNNIKDINKFSIFLRKFFKNLRKIYLRDFDLKDKETIINFAIAFKGVREIEMDNCELSDNNFKMLFQINQLEVVKFIHIKGFIGTSLEGLTRNLREITLCCCSHVDPKLFSKFCKEHPNLQSLNIIGCRWIDEICLNAIAANLKELESLKISDSYEKILDKDYFLLADLPMLKDLKIIRYPSFDPADVNSLLLRISTHNRLESLIWSYLPVTPITEEALRNLTKLKELHVNDAMWDFKFKDSTLECLPTSIEYLHIPNSNVSPKNLELFIMRCSNLRLLNVAQCRSINENFIHQILPHLRGRSHMLELEVAEWQISQKDRKDLLMTHIGRNPTKLMLTINYNY